jgi:cystathionine beta-lyase/cystathionine gamma-synthase
MQKSRRTRGIQTRLIHSPQAANDTTAVSPPIYQTSTFLEHSLLWWLHAGLRLCNNPDQVIVSLFIRRSL